MFKPDELGSVSAYLETVCELLDWAPRDLLPLREPIAGLRKQRKAAGQCMVLPDRNPKFENLKKFSNGGGLSADGAADGKATPSGMGSVKGEGAAL
ncbi:MAG: hypothetical protein AB3X44_20510 [Leptothrix sp. (in: b-proteobacteria)]